MNFIETFWYYTYPYDVNWQKQGNYLCTHVKISIEKRKKSMKIEYFLVFRVVLEAPVHLYDTRRWLSAHTMPPNLAIWHFWEFFKFKVLCFFQFNTHEKYVKLYIVCVYGGMRAPVHIYVTRQWLSGRTMPSSLWKTKTSMLKH